MTTVYSNWSQFLADKYNPHLDGKKLTKDDDYYVGSGEQSTIQSVIYWPKKSN